MYSICQLEIYDLLSRTKRTDNKCFVLNNWPHCVNDWHHGLSTSCVQGSSRFLHRDFPLKFSPQPWELTTIIITILQKRELRRWKHTQGQLLVSNGEAQIWIQEVSLGIVCTQSQSLHQSISLIPKIVWVPSVKS